jgi:UDP-glucuronate decarboxylase
MNSSDGRLVSNFCVAALSGHPLEIYGTGLQTRSLMFIQDLIDGLISLMESEVVDPVNIGSEDEKTVEEWARVIRDTVEVMRSEGSLSPLPIPLCNEEEEEGEEERGEKGEGWKASEIVFKDAVVDDPPRRKPDISRARQVLGWEPKWTVESGMRETIMWYAAQGEED